MLGVQKLHAASKPANFGKVCSRNLTYMQAAGGTQWPLFGTKGYKQTFQRAGFQAIRSESFKGSTHNRRAWCPPRVVLESAFQGTQVVVAGRAPLTGRKKRRHQGRVKAFAKTPPAVETTTDSLILRTLWPSSASHKQGYVKVSELHTIYYEVFGNKDGKPAVFLHGGPGAGCSANHSRFFDPERYRIVLFDQRGCGKSTPRGCLEENDTWALVEDLEKLRTALEIDKWLVVGGSWGTTLALAYAQTHPQRVSAMVLRAVCMMRQREIDWFYTQGADALFPFAWDHYVAHIPEEERGDLLKAYYHRLTSEDRQTADAAARSWLRWEFSLLSFSNMPVVVSWDGKEYKSLPTPVAAASTDKTPSNGPSPASKPGVTSGVSAQPSAVSAQSATSPSSNGSDQGQAGVQVTVAETSQKAETASTFQQGNGIKLGTGNGNGKGNGKMGESVATSSERDGEAQAGSEETGLAESETGNGNESDSGMGSQSRKEIGNETGSGTEKDIQTEIASVESRTESGDGNGNGAESGSGTEVEIGIGTGNETRNETRTSTGSGTNSGKDTEKGDVTRNGTGTQNETGPRTETGTNSGNGKANGSGKGAVQEGGTAAAVPSDELEVGRKTREEIMRGGDWVSSSLAQARLESHYSMNKAFFSEDQLLKGVDRIRKIPTVAIQGRYDFVCPIKTAFDLHSAWPEMELRVVPNAGHSQYEPGITHEIITATDKFKDIDY